MIGISTTMVDSAQSLRVGPLPASGGGRGEAGSEMRHPPPHDALTGLPNRRVVAARLAAMVAQSTAISPPSAVILIDIGAFATIVQNIGTTAGDLLVRHVTSRLLGSLRESDMLARTGRSQFTLVLSDVDRVEDLDLVCRRLSAAVRDPFDLLGQTTYVVLGFGVGLLSYETKSIQDLLDQTEAALQHALADGANAVRHADEELDRRAQLRRVLVQELGDVLSADALELDYAAQFRIADGRLLGKVATPRWPDSATATAAGGGLLQLADEHDLSERLFLRVLGAACSSKAEGESRAGSDIGLTVDLPAAVLINDDLPAIIKHQLERQTAIAPGRLTLAVSESAAATLRSAQLAALRAIRDDGVKIGLRSFGSFDGGLARLTRLPFDQIEVDLSVLDEGGISGPSAAAIQAGLSMGQAIGIKTGARAVATEEQLLWLARCGCAVAQGPLLATAHRTPA